MKFNTLVLMGLAAVLAVVAAVWVSSSRAPEESALSPGPLVPGLAKQIDAITQVQVRTAGQDATTMTLTRENGVWGLVEKSHYPVDMDRLRNVLTAIANAQRVEAKTALSARYAQLGVDDLDHVDARGVQVDVHLPERTVSLIFGDNVVRGAGTYVRESGQAQSWLIDSSIAVERKPANWLDKQIIDVGANRVLHVDVKPLIGAAFELVRSTDDPASDFALSPIPRGRELAENYQREALAGVLSGLTFEDVFAVADRPVPEKTQHTTFALEDGRQLGIDSWQEGAQTMVHLSMVLDAAVADAWLARPVAEAEASSDSSAGVEPNASNASTASGEAKLDRADLQAQVEAFQKAHADWVYVLPAFKASNLNKALEDYLKPKG